MAKKRTIRETEYKSADGKTIRLASMKKTVVQDGVTYVRQPRPKYMSRSARAGKQADEWRGAADELDDIKSRMEKLEPEADIQDGEETAEELKDEAQAVLDSLDFSELECLTEEMTSWRDNMGNTGLVNTSKYEEVDEAASTLEGIDASVDGCIDTPEDIESLIDELNQKADELEGVNFPGMY